MPLSLRSVNESPPDAAPTGAISVELGQFYRAAPAGTTGKAAAQRLCGQAMLVQFRRSLSVPLPEFVDHCANSTTNCECNDWVTIVSYPLFRTARYAWCQECRNDVTDGTANQQRRPRPKVPPLQ
ncbi:MAG: hypothetical protein ABSG53_20655 [Thermoguttaceae bacterium]